jgi:hypothetical protein
MRSAARSTASVMGCVASVSAVKQIATLIGMLSRSLGLDPREKIGEDVASWVRCGACGLLGVFCFPHAGIGESLEASWLAG